VILIWYMDHSAWGLRKTRLFESSDRRSMSVSASSEARRICSPIDSHWEIRAIFSSLLIWSSLLFCCCFDTMQVSHPSHFPRTQRGVTCPALLGELRQKDG
jgi:hypothetical protein